MKDIEYESFLNRLKAPEGMIDAVIDTDTFNEVDDQYALSYLIKSNDKVNLKAIYAAPFLNENSTSPEDGMEKSYNEIKNILTLIERDDLKNVVYKGSRTYLPNEDTAVVSEAAGNLVERALRYTPEKPLYVVTIGVGTDIASAILLNRDIIDRIVIVWLTGHSYDWPDTREFNMYQDIAAARVIFNSGAAFVQVPCLGVITTFVISDMEYDYWFKGKNALCDYLVKMTKAREHKNFPDKKLWSSCLADMGAVAWLMNKNLVEDRLVPCPIPEYDNTYTFDKSRRPIRYVYHINRDNLLLDMINKLTK